MHNIKALEHTTAKIKKKLNLNDEQLYFSLSSNGYFEAFGSLFKGIRYSDDINCIVQDVKILRGNNALKECESDLRIIINVVENNYKLHGMPYSLKEVKKAIRILCVALKTNESFQQSLYRFSIMLDLDFDEPDLATILEQQGIYPGIMPIIKIYPASQRENAQTLLNTCHSVFATMQGLKGIVPRYNKSITDFLSYAHDNGDTKLLNMEFFQEDLVHLDDNFKHTLLPEFFDPIETKNCYHLKDPRL